MDLIGFNKILTEISIDFNLIIAVFILQIGLFFIKQWYNEKKAYLSNFLILGFGIFFLFISLSKAIFAYIIVNAYYYYQSPYSFENFYFYYLLALAFIAFGGIIFTFIVERQIIKKTKYILTLIFAILLVFIPFATDYLFSNSILTILGISIVALSFFFMIHAIKQIYGKVRQKLIISSIGLIFIYVEFLFASYNIKQLIENLSNYPAFIYFPIQLGTILGCVLIFYGFYGYSFLIESEWRNNLIALFIIDKIRNIELYHKDFFETGIRREQLLAGGIAGIIRMVKEFTESKKDIDTINLGNNFLVLTHGEKIISALLLKKETQIARHFLKIITLKFEFLFWDYLKYYESYKERMSQDEMYKPIDMLIQDIIKM